MFNAENQIIMNQRVGNHMAEQLEANLPLTAVFRYSIRFEVCGTENLGLLKLEYYEPGKVFGQLGVHRKGTDRMYSNFISAATAKEMARCLRDPETHQEWVEQIKNLSEKVNKYWD